MLKFSRADTGTIVAAGSSACHLSTSSSSFSGVVRSILLITARVGISLWRIFFEDVVRTVALFHRVGDVEDYVRIVHGAGDEFHHRFLEFVAGFQDARRIREDDLEIFAADHSQNAVARGLGFGGDDREAFAYECVHQRRFARRWDFR